MNGFLTALLIDVIGGIISTLIGGLLTSYFVPSKEMPPLVIELSPRIIVPLYGGPQAPLPPLLPQVSPADDFQCTDRYGRQGAFGARVVLDTYNWVRGSSELAEFNGEVIPYFPTVLRQEPVQKVLSGAQAIVAVGMASCESPLGFLFENRRAEQRAEQLVRWIEESRDSLPSRPGTPMRNVIPLNLGRYNKECAAPEASETSRQRRIVLIAVTENPKGLDLESCLQRRMQEDRSLKFLTDNYSKFDLDPGWKS